MCKFIKTLFVLWLIFILFASCTKTPVLKGKQSSLLFYAGAEHGGVVENRRLAGVDNMSSADAITSATKMQFCGGIHTEICLIQRLFIETGLDYVGFAQSLKYTIPTHSIDGERDIAFHQLYLPLTYNFHYNNRDSTYARFIFKLGLATGITLSESESSVKGTLAEYTINKITFGPTIGISYFPLHIKEKFRLGMYLDFYRGTKMLDDIYHVRANSGGMSFMKFGFVFHFPGINFGSE